MQKVILLIGMLVASTTMFAQEDSSGEREELRFEKIKERLELTENQVKEWKEMKEKYRPELKAIRSDDSKERHEKMRAAADVMEKQQEELAKILTEDQLSELQTIREEAKGKNNKRRKRGN